MRTVRHSNPFLEILEQRRLLSFSSGATPPPEDPNAHVVWAPPPPLLADFTNDGILDKISSNSHEVLVRPGLGDGTFGNPIHTSIWPTPGAPLLAVADFNGDFRLDVFTGAAIDFESPPTVNVLLGRGDGAFVLTETFSVGTVPTMIGTGEIFGTGRTDVAITGYDYLSGEQGVLHLFNDGLWVTPPIIRTYVGPTGGNWSTASNWSPSGVPTASDVVAISGKSVNVPANAAFASLTLAAGASLSMAYTGASPIGSWNGSAYTGISGMIQSRRIAATPSGRLNAIGVADTPGAVAVKFTYAGDANLDGKLNVDDYMRIDQGIAAQKTGWSNGDFNYDGKINTDDYVIIDSNIPIQGPPLSSSAVVGALSASKPPLNWAQGRSATTMDLLEQASSQ